MPRTSDRISQFVCAAIAVALLFIGLPAAATAHDVAFVGLHVDVSRANRHVPVALWYPTDAAARPTRIGPYTMHVAKGASIAAGRFGLIVVAHGSGGSALSHFDTALALARRGYIVAAPTFAHDNFRDHSGAGSLGVLTSRAVTVSTVIGDLLGNPKFSSHIDRARIGAVGYSAGAATVLALLGAEPSVPAMVHFCKTRPKAIYCLRWRDGLNGNPSAPFALADDRIRAGVVMAPVTGWFATRSLAKIAAPLRIYLAADDHEVSEPGNGRRLAKAVGDLDKLVTVPNAGHFSFLAPIPASLKPHVGPIADDPAGFDRGAFHERFDRQVTAFFDKSLPR